MNFATLTISQLLQHDANIGRHLDRPAVVNAAAAAREWLDARRAVRRELEARHVASTN